MSTLGQAGTNLRQLGDRLPLIANEIVKIVALTVDEHVVRGTPVDTGLARSNWLMSLNSPRSDVISPYAPGQKLGKNETANATQAIEQAAAALAGRRPGQTVYLTNNVHYIGSLNRGTSRQAGEFFVQLAVRAGIEALNGKTFIRRIG